MTHIATVLAQLPTDSCVNWPGVLNKDGYGQHRTVWKRLGGTHPGRPWTLDHLCRNRACVNPAHLELVTHRENVLRGETLPAMNAVKTECKHGHPLEGANLYVRGDGERACRACNREHQARFKNKTK